MKCNNHSTTWKCFWSSNTRCPLCLELPLQQIAPADWSSTPRHPSPGRCSWFFSRPFNWSPNKSLYPSASCALKLEHLGFQRKNAGGFLRTEHCFGPHHRLCQTQGGARTNALGEGEAAEARGTGTTWNHWHMVGLSENGGTSTFGGFQLLIRRHFFQIQWISSCHLPRIPWVPQTHSTRSMAALASPEVPWNKMEKPRRSL